MTFLLSWVRVCTPQTTHADDAWRPRSDSRTYHPDFTNTHFQRAVPDSRTRLRPLGTMILTGNKVTT